MSVYVRVFNLLRMIFYKMFYKYANLGINL